MKIGGKHHTGDWGKNISKKKHYKIKLNGKELFRKTKNVFIKI